MTVKISVRLLIFHVLVAIKLIIGSRLEFDWNGLVNPFLEIKVLSSVNHSIKFFGNCEVLHYSTIWIMIDI